MTTVLTKEEIDERVAVLHRLRTLLEQQREKFRQYLTVLEKQEHVIEEENGEALVAQTELEQEIVSGISHLQRIIEPIESMYTNTHHSPDEIVPSLKTDLLDLQTKVLKQNEKNRDLLKVHIESIKSKLHTIKNPYTSRKSVYASSSHSASVIDVTG